MVPLATDSNHKSAMCSGRPRSVQNETKNKHKDEDMYTSGMQGHEVIHVVVQT